MKEKDEDQLATIQRELGDLARVDDAGDDELDQLLDAVNRIRKLSNPSEIDSPNIWSQVVDKISKFDSPSKGNTAG